MEKFIVVGSVLSAKFFCVIFFNFDTFFLSESIIILLYTLAEGWIDQARTCKVEERKCCLSVTCLETSNFVINMMPGFTGMFFSWFSVDSQIKSSFNTFKILWSISSCYLIFILWSCCYFFCVENCGFSSSHSYLASIKCHYLLAFCLVLLLSGSKNTLCRDPSSIKNIRAPFICY